MHAALTRQRITVAMLVVLMHLAALYLVLASRSASAPPEPSALTSFDVAPLPARPVPPPPPPKVQPARAAAPSGAAGRMARRTPVTAPSPIVAPLPAPITAAIVPDTGSASVGGTAAVGVGTGAANGGAGAGVGGSGTGIGSGGARAHLIKGAIRNKDYPKAERTGQVQGTVTVGFTVGTNGRASGCRVVRSSGSVALDAATCTLIVERFRYAPATDAGGRPVAEERGWQQRWWIAGVPGE